MAFQLRVGSARRHLELHHGGQRELEDGGSSTAMGNLLRNASALLNATAGSTIPGNCTNFSSYDPLVCQLNTTELKHHIVSSLGDKLEYLTEGRV